VTYATLGGGRWLRFPHGRHDVSANDIWSRTAINQRCSERTIRPSFLYCTVCRHQKANKLDYLLTCNQSTKRKATRQSGWKSIEQLEQSRNEDSLVFWGQWSTMTGPRVHRRESDWNSGGMHGGTYYKSPAVEAKNTFSYIVMQVIWCFKFCNMTKSGGQSPRSKFWGTCLPTRSPVIYAHARARWIGVGFETTVHH